MMDNIKLGKMIAAIRKEKSMTQKELADKLNVSDKAISKWERGLGFPDISLLDSLAEVLEVNVNEVLSGDTIANGNDSGNMKKTKFYACPRCGNIITSTSELIMNCCGKKLQELTAVFLKQGEHIPKIEHVEDELYITIPHSMDKQHYISFIAYVTGDKLILTKLYPEQSAEVRFKLNGHGIIYCYCSVHGLHALRI